MIVHLYEEHGAGCIERLDGMFALAIWDEPRRRLILARDRAGKKPLFYLPRSERAAVRVGDQGVSRASRRSRRRSIDDAVPPYFLHGYVPVRETSIAASARSSRATIVTFDRAGGAIAERRYWQLTFPTPTAPGAVPAAREATRDASASW